MTLKKCPFDFLSSTPVARLDARRQTGNTDSEFTIQEAYKIDLAPISQGQDSFHTGPRSSRLVGRLGYDS